MNTPPDTSGRSTPPADDLGTPDWDVSRRELSQAAGSCAVLTALVVLLVLVGGTSGAAEPMSPCPDGRTDRARGCLTGVVERVITTRATFRRVDGAWVEGDAVLSWTDPTLVYDRQGNLAERHEYDVDGSLRSEIAYLYDTSGRLREALSVGGDGALQARTVFRYDGRGRKTGERRLDAAGATQVDVEFAYDVLGRMIEEVVRKPTGEEALKWVYSYDTGGHRSREALYAAHGAVVPGPVSRTYTYETPEHRRPTGELAFDANGALLERITYQYDERGNRTEETRYDPAGFLLGTTALEYEFDAQGNWVKRTRSKRFGNLSVRPMDVTYRAVVYFEQIAAPSAR